jgi:hypothetical protein
MDMTNYAESEYVNKEYVASLQNKRGVILDAGNLAPTKFGERVMFSVSFQGGKVKKWTPTREQISQLVQGFGKDSVVWSGKCVYFQVLNDKVIVTPIMEHVENLL